MYIFIQVSIMTKYLKNKLSCSRYSKYANWVCKMN